MLVGAKVRARWQRFFTEIFARIRKLTDTFLLFPALDVWDYRIDTGHISGGMMYSKGKLKVPLSGLYTIYSQIYYTSKTYSGRHAIRINNRTVALSEARGLKVAGSAITLGAFHVNKDDEISIIVVYNAEIFTGKWHTFFGAHLI